jgi:hypothetical protein
VIAPTASQVRSWSKLGFAELGFADDTSLGRLVAVAVSTLRRITGIDLAAVEVWQEPEFQMAIQGLAEQLAFQAQPDQLETLSDWDLIQSFSAGPYSETRRSAEDAFKARMLNPWPWLNRLLWGLLSPDMFDYWTAFFSGTQAPAFAVTEMDWGAYEDVDGSSYSPWWDRPMWGSGA